MKLFLFCAKKVKRNFLKRFACTCFHLSHVLFQIVIVMVQYHEQQYYNNVSSIIIGACLQVCITLVQTNKTPSAQN